MGMGDDEGGGHGDLEAQLQEGGFWESSEDEG